MELGAELLIAAVQTIRASGMEQKTEDDMETIYTYPNNPREWHGAEDHTKEGKSMSNSKQSARVAWSRSVKLGEGNIVTAQTIRASGMEQKDLSALVNKKKNTNNPREWHGAEGIFYEKRVPDSPNNPREWHGAEANISMLAETLPTQTIRASGMEQKKIHLSRRLGVDQTIRASGMEQKVLSHHDGVKVRPKQSARVAWSRRPQPCG